MQILVSVSFLQEQTCVLQEQLQEANRKADAKVMFKKVHSSSIPAEEIDAWSTEEFLANSMMMRDGEQELS